MKKQDGRRIKPEAQEAIRLRIVHFLKRGKRTQEEAAKIFQLSLPGVKKIWKRFKEGGTAALKPRRRGPVRSTARLSGQQVAMIKKFVKKDTPEAYRVLSFLWTAEAVGRLLKKKRR